MFARRHGHIPTMRQLTANARARDKARAGRHRDGAMRPTRDRALWLLRRRLAIWHAFLSRAYVSSGVPELGRALTVLRRSWRRLLPAAAPVLVSVPRQASASTAVARRESAPERDTGRRLGAHSIRRMGWDTAEHRALISSIMAGVHALRDGALAPGEMTWKQARLADRFIA